MARNTPQLEAWQGDFGNAHVDRNPASERLIGRRTAGLVQYGFPWKRASSLDDVNYGLLRKS